jgi:hypothetical protein
VSACPEIPNSSVFARFVQSFVLFELRRVVRFRLIGTIRSASSDHANRTVTAQCGAHLSRVHAERTSASPGSPATHDWAHILIPSPHNQRRTNLGASKVHAGRGSSLLSWVGGDRKLGDGGGRLRLCPSGRGLRGVGAYLGGYRSAWIRHVFDGTP